MQIGIDLGGSHIAVGIVSDKNVIVTKKEMDIFKVQPEEEMKQYLIDNIKLLISEVLKEIGAPSCVISKIAIAVPGRVKDGIAYDMYNLGINQFEITKILSEHYGIEDIVIRNDAKCAALAEKEKGNLKEYDDCVFLCLGTGIGGATFVNGRMIDYTKEWCSEFGHTIIEKDGIQCNCGNKGCWEQYASMNAFKKGLINILNLPTDISSKELLDILKNNIKAGNRVVDDYINKYMDFVVTGILNISNVLQPEAICIGGGFTYYADILNVRLLERMNLIKFNGIKPKIVLAKLENDAGIIGSLL